MAPLTRMRATVPGDVPNDADARVLRPARQRRAASSREGTQISPEGKGYMDTPGIHSDEQVAGWRDVTDAVHEAGGLIAAQLWHVGRVNHESFHDGELPVSASAIAVPRPHHLRGADGGRVRADCPTPRALGTDEIPRLVEDYRRATVNAREAGFDLVEIHGAHGYLLHQFLAAGSNQRTDAYGGSLADRARLMLEVIDAGHRSWSRRPGRRPDLPDRLVQRHRGPRRRRHRAARRRRAGRRAASPSCTSPSPTGPAAPRSTDDYRARCARPTPGPSSAAGNYDLEKAERLLSAGWIDAAAFGRAFIANPDLPRRLAEERCRSTPQRPETFYGGDAEGYTDYPAYA